MILLFSLPQFILLHLTFYVSERFQTERFSQVRIGVTGAGGVNLRKRNEFTKLLCSSGLPDIGEKGRFCHEAGGVRDR